MGNTYNYQDWIEIGTRHFGANRRNWKFIYPGCRGIQTPRAMEQYQQNGALPMHAYMKCIGNFTGGRKGPHGCEWKSLGKHSGPDVVLAPGGEKIYAFQFYLERKGFKDED